MQSEYRDFFFEEEADTVLVYDSIDAWRGRTPVHIAISEQLAKDWVDQQTSSNVQNTIEEHKPAAPESACTRPVIPVGMLQAVDKLFARHKLYIDPESTIVMFHFTRKENVHSILREGLRPKTSSGLGGAIGGTTHSGVYLTPSVEEAENILYDYNMREERVPGVFSLLKVRIRGNWLAYEDPEVFSSYGEKPTLIIPRYIEPGRITLHTENFHTVEPVTDVYREFPGIDARTGNRVRIITGEHHDEEGIITSIPDLAGLKAIWPIRLDSGEITTAREDEIITLIR